jgi:hypothetical protein
VDKTGGRIGRRTSARPSIPKQDPAPGNDANYDQDDRHYRHDPDDRYDRYLHHVNQHLHFDKHFDFDQHVHFDKHFDHTDEHSHHNDAGLFDTRSRPVVCRRKAGLLLMGHGAHQTLAQRHKERFRFGQSIRPTWRSRVMRSAAPAPVCPVFLHH